MIKEQEGVYAAHNAFRESLGIQVKTAWNEWLALNDMPSGIRSWENSDDKTRELCRHIGERLYWLGYGGKR